MSGISCECTNESSISCSKSQYCCNYGASSEMRTQNTNAQIKNGLEWYGKNKTKRKITGSITISNGSGNLLFIEIPWFAMMMLVVGTIFSKYRQIRLNLSTVLHYGLQSWCFEHGYQTVLFFESWQLNLSFVSIKSEIYNSLLVISSYRLEY